MPPLDPNVPIEDVAGVVKELIQEGKVKLPIPGTRKLERRDENLAAATVQLRSDDLQEIASAASTITVQGARYSESSQRMIDR